MDDITKKALAREADTVRDLSASYVDSAQRAPRAMQLRARLLELGVEEQALTRRFVAVSVLLGNVVGMLILECELPVATTLGWIIGCRSHGVLPRIEVADALQLRRLANVALEELDLCMTPGRDRQVAATFIIEFLAEAMPHAVHD